MREDEGQQQLNERQRYFALALEDEAGMSEEEFHQWQTEQERYEMEDRSELYAALAAAQAELGPAIKGSVNPHFKSSYADLTACLEGALPVLSKHGLALIQLPGNKDGMVTVTTILGHKSGQCIEGTFGMAPRDSGPHSMASCVTYLRRYSLAIFGCFADDDDANAAQGKAVPLSVVPNIEPIKAKITGSAKKGMVELEKAWKSTPDDARKAIVDADPDFLDNLKAVAGSVQ
jgi:hypothetical protein